jgi:hypothetical protein
MPALVPRPYLALAAGLVVAGAVLLAAGVELGGFVVLGLGALAAVALAFYAVGRSEDRERETHPHG